MNHLFTRLVNIITGKSKISRRAARIIAEKHHGPGIEIFQITDDIAGHCRLLYRYDNSWGVKCSFTPGRHESLTSSRVIIISKETGDILYDGSASDEG